MNKIFIVIILVNLTVRFNAMGQSNIISGLITADSQRQNGAIVKNINTRAQTMSNDIGEFSIGAAVGDTIVTLKPDYNNDTLLVSSAPYYIIYLKKAQRCLKKL